MKKVILISLAIALAGTFCTAVAQQTQPGNKNSQSNPQQQTQGKSDQKSTPASSTSPTSNNSSASKPATTNPTSNKTSSDDKKSSSSSDKKSTATSNSAKKGTSTNPDKKEANTNAGKKESTTKKDQNIETNKKGVTKPNYQQGVAVKSSVRDDKPKTISAPKKITKPSNYKTRTDIASIGDILGLAFYSTIKAGLDYLFEKDYYIDGYDDNTVYLRDVNQLDFDWDDVNLNYSNGQLDNAQFIYSTSKNDETRYNAVYKELCRLYGDPVVLEYNAYTPSGYAAWYGLGDKNYVTLEYYKDYSNSGKKRYYTILSYCSDL